MQKSVSTISAIFIIKKKEAACGMRRVPHCTDIYTIHLTNILLILYFIFMYEYTLAICPKRLCVGAYPSLCQIPSMEYNKNRGLRTPQYPSIYSIYTQRHVQWFPWIVDMRFLYTRFSVRAQSSEGDESVLNHERGLFTSTRRLWLAFNRPSAQQQQQKPVLSSQAEQRRCWMCDIGKEQCV